MKLYLSDPDFTLYQGDALEVLRSLPDESVDCCITSPPYEDARPEYGGSVPWTFLMQELRRVVKGPLAINVGRLWRDGKERLWWHKIIVAGAWNHLDTLVWVKPNANPIHGAVLISSHEYVLLFGRSVRDFNVDGVRTPYTAEGLARMGRRFLNGRGVKGDALDSPVHRERGPHELGARPRSYVTIGTGREKNNPHPAPMAAGLAEHLVDLCSWPGQLVLDPFIGSGTTALATRKQGRRCVGIELNPAYCEMAAKRLAQQSLFAVDREAARILTEEK